MNRTLHTHPLTIWTALAAVATGVGFSTDLSIDDTDSGHAVEQVDAVVIEVKRETIDLHIPRDSPLWGGANTLCGAAGGVMVILRYTAPNCQIGYQPPPTETTVATLYVTDDRVRMDFAAQSMIGDVAADGSFGNWAVLDRTTGQTAPWPAPPGGGPGLASMSSSVSLSNLIGQFGGIRSSSTGPTLQATGGPPAGHSAYHYAYTVSGGLDLPNGTETGLVIRVEGWAGYADQGPLFQDGRIITVIDDLAGNMLFQHMQPPAALAGLRDIGGLLSVDEVVKIAAYRGSAAQGDISGTVLEILEGQVRTEILDARRQSVPASMFGAGPAAACDCSCDGLTAFKQFADLPRSQQEQDPRAMTLISCGRQCARQWALGCHP